MPQLQYEKTYFNPEKSGGAAVADNTELTAFEWTIPAQPKPDATRSDPPPADVRDVYVFTPRVTLAVNVALATKRPLLVAGEPGSGKTRLAVAVAEVLRWQYFPTTVTSRTQATDLLWRFDALRRLNDATTRETTLRPDQHYIEPQALWWGFDPATAASRGKTPLENPVERALNPSRRATSEGSVVLVDEIDKADPDVPNDLLEPFDARRFTVKETNDRIEATRDVFLVLTTNGERSLPPAFLRRCVMLVLDEPDAPWFARVAAQHFPNGSTSLHEQVAHEVARLRKDTKPGLRKPSTAEYLDALRVCYDLHVDPSMSDWSDITNITLVKSDQTPKPKSAAATAKTSA